MGIWGKRSRNEHPEQPCLWRIGYRAGVIELSERGLLRYGSGKGFGPVDESEIFQPPTTSERLESWSAEAPCLKNRAPS